MDNRKKQSTMFASCRGAASMNRVINDLENMGYIFKKLHQQSDSSLLEFKLNDTNVLDAMLPVMAMMLDGLMKSKRDRDNDNHSFSQN